MMCDVVFVAMATAVVMVCFPRRLRHLANISILIYVTCEVHDHHLNDGRSYLDTEEFASYITSVGCTHLAAEKPSITTSIFR